MKKIRTANAYEMRNETASVRNYHTLSGKPAKPGDKCRYYFNYPRSVPCVLIGIFEKTAWVQISKDFTTPEGVHVGRGRRVMVRRGNVKPLTAGTKGAEE